MDRPRVCILSFSPIFRDGRVLRQIEYASKEYDVDVIGYGKWSPKWPGVRFREVHKPGHESRFKNVQLLLFLLAGRIAPSVWMRAYWWQTDCREAIQMLLEDKYEMIHANDLKALPVAIAAAHHRGGKVLFDAHEYYPGQAKYSSLKNSFFYQGYVQYLLRTFGSKADAFVTVSKGLAEVYRRAFKMEAEVIMNVPAHAEIKFRAVEPENIRLIHHGGAAPERQLEKLIQMVEVLPKRFSLHFMLIRDGAGYVEELKKVAEKGNPGRVFFREPVEPSKVVETLAGFDIGVYSLPPVTVNSKLALPNKLFDFCAAGLAVVIGPSPEMARFVREYGFGVIADGFEAEDVALALQNLTLEDINRMKLEAIKGSQVLNADVEMAKLMRIYGRLLKKSENA